MGQALRLLTDMDPELVIVSLDGVGAGARRLPCPLRRVADSRQLAEAWARTGQGGPRPTGGAGGPAGG